MFITASVRDGERQEVFAAFKSRTNLSGKRKINKNWEISVLFLSADLFETLQLTNGLNYKSTAEQAHLKHMIQVSNAFSCWSCCMDSAGIGLDHVCSYCSKTGHD